MHYFSVGVVWIAFAALWGAARTPEDAARLGADYPIAMSYLTTPNIGLAFVLPAFYTMVIILLIRSGSRYLAPITGGVLCVTLIYVSTVLAALTTCLFKMCGPV